MDISVEARWLTFNEVTDFDAQGTLILNYGEKNYVTSGNGTRVLRFPGTSTH